MHAVELAMVQHMYSPNNVFNVTWPKYFINIIFFQFKYFHCDGILWDDEQVSNVLVTASSSKIYFSSSL